MKNIVITDYDIISASGNGKEEFSKNILTKSDFSRKVTSFNTSNLKTDKAYEVNIDFTEYLGKLGLKHINRNSKLSFAAIEKLLLPYFADLPEEEKPGVVLGTAFGSVESIANFWRVYLTEGNQALRPLEFPNTVINATGSFVNIRYLISDVSATISTGFNSSLDALIYAYDYIQNGYGEKLLTGGSEELGEFLYSGEEKSGSLSKTGKLQPFSKNGDGFVPGEGAAFFMIETLESAKKRSAKILAELVGFDSIFSKNEEDGSECYNRALKMAQIKPEQIDLVSSSANGNNTNDKKIFNIYKNVFGDRLKNVAVTSHKSFSGECYGASGALQLAAALSNIESGKLSPVLSSNLIEENDCFKTEKINKKINYFAIDGFSCDGNNAVLVFKNYAS
jgi:3-oxoacyl-[acyl-carrier-protein] synthase II